MGKLKNKPAGEKRYNPYRKFLGAFTPNWLLRRSVKEISWGAKATFGRLTEFAGVNGKCFPPVERISEELGVSERTIQRYLRELKQLKLIEIHHRAGSSNEYHFLDHPWIEWAEKTPPYMLDPSELAPLQPDLSTTPDNLVGGRGDRSVVSNTTNLSGRGDRSVAKGVTNLSPIKDNIKLNLKDSPKKARGRAKGGDFNLFEDAGLNSQDENLHFSQSIASYPKNPHHRNLYAIQKLWVERRIDGFTGEQILEGVKKYRAYCDGINITGKKSVMSLARFFGDELNFNNPWGEELTRHKKENNPYSRYD
jgi:hypothetical protein